MAEKILRPLPEYVSVSVRNMAASSSVGSRLELVLASRVAGTPGATPSRATALDPVTVPGPPEERALPAALSRTVGAVVTAGAGRAAGVLGPPNSDE